MSQQEKGMPWHHQGVLFHVEVCFKINEMTFSWCQINFQTCLNMKKNEHQGVPFHLEACLIISEIFVTTETSITQTSSCCSSV
jgi:hypothetical protein